MSHMVENETDIPPTRRALIAEIEAFCETRGMSPSDFGKQAAGDTSLLVRLRGGMSIGIDRMDALRKWMRDWKPGKAKR